MPARRADDPLVLVPLRLPKSLVDAARNEAAATGATLSDAIRSRIESSAVKPLGKPRSRRRAALPVESVSRSDPALIRQVAVIGSNLNQLARVVNSAMLSGTPIEVIVLLTRLCAIERHINSLTLTREAAAR